MDDTLRPKHHINPPAQCDSPKDAAAVSPPPQAQGKRRADCEEEDTPVTKHGEPRLDGVAPGNGEEKRERRPLEREEQERKALARAGRLESREGGQTCNRATGE